MHTATRIDVLRDSLDSAEGLGDRDDADLQRVTQESTGGELNASVLDENTGKIVKVIFDPVLKCYYEPSQNVYYQVKDV